MLFGLSTPPSDVLVHIGQITIYYYGALIALAVCAGFLVSLYLAKEFEKTFSEHIIHHIDAMFLWVGGAGVIGGRLFFVLYHWNYFFSNPSEIIALWHGGWVWHGALIFGLIALGAYCFFRKVSFLVLAGLLSPGVTLGQAIGRWGNYFNQEAYGLPLQAWWAIPIDSAHRLSGYEQYETFHPAFLYESIGDAILFIVLMYLVVRIYKKARDQKIERLFFLYLIFYSLLRFGIEYIRIDAVPVFWGLRMPQWISMGIMVLSISIFVFLFQKRTPLAKNNSI